MLSASAVPGGAATSNWKDVQGNVIKGEPVEVLGPFALFRSGVTSGRRMLLRGLEPAECLRFHRETAGRPPRAASLAEARGAATRDLPGRVLRLERGELVAADLTAQPEPELLVVLYASHNEGDSWRMLGNFISIYRRMQRVYPGRTEMLYFGVRQDAAQHRRIATELHLPWLVADPLQQSRMSLLARFAPREGCSLLAISRDGAPLLSASGNDLESIIGFADQLGDLLGLMNPANPRTWKDRVHYQAAIRPEQHRRDSVGPLLLGNPLRVDGLRQRGVDRIDAAIDVAADGRVAAVALSPTSRLPDAMQAPVADALRRNALFVPAIDHGNPVPGTFHLTIEVPPADPAAEADAAWLSGDPVNEVTFGTWLVLKPIFVPEQEFVSVDHVTADGVYVTRPLEVSDQRVTRTQQQSAFSSNWFDAAGAASVRPAVGDSVTIDGTTLTWKEQATRHGLLDFQEGLSRLDYCIGYAWTEFELPAATEAWLGIGSDDGLKIWHNGTLVHDRWIRRISRIDDEVVPLRLTKGRNQLLIKIQNAWGDWSFIARLRVRLR